MKNTVTKREVSLILSKTIGDDAYIDTTYLLEYDYGLSQTEISKVLSEISDFFNIELCDNMPTDFSVQFLIDITQEKINDKIMNKYILDAKDYV